MQDASSTLIDIITCLIKEVSRIANVDETKTKKLVSRLMNIGNTAIKVAAKTAANRVLDGGAEIVDGLYTESGKSSISEIREELEAVIEECIKKDNKKGFVFFIDDLDRIDPPVAVQLLELLKNIFTLNNCVFVLAIDYDVVINGLEPKFGKISEHNEREFRSFFDKIIQVPFSMPVTSYRVDEFLKDGLLTTNYITSDQANNADLISKFSEISSLSVGSNPRALKRLLNSLSLISCINAAKGESDDGSLTDDLELVVNFSLVSIQIAYPQVYKLLSMYNGFDKWNEHVALEMNLAPLDERSKEKLEASEEFDEVWEQVLFRLCEKDYFLKKKALNISRLLNKLKATIKEKNGGDQIEDVIGAVISLSSVTNLEAFDKPVVDFHRSSFLKHLRHLLIPKLKDELPEIKDLISAQGKRVQTNAYIKFTKEDWGHWVRLHSHPHEGKVRLILISDKWMCKAKRDTLQDCINEAGLSEEFKSLEERFMSIPEKYPSYTNLNFMDEVGEREDCFIVDLYLYLSLPSVEAFYQPEVIQTMSQVLAEVYHLLVDLQTARDKLRLVFG